MKISIEESVLSKYPCIELGFLQVMVKVEKSNLFVDSLKQGLLESVQQRGINATNYAVHPKISIWRKLYREDFQLKEGSYRSSVESLVRRIATGKDLWNISNIVDLYNCCSILSLLPMGGYDVHKISGDIKIRHAKDGEIFHAIGERLKVQTLSNQVVYADDQRVICWLWNHKDAQETCIDDDTKQVIFFVDSVDGFNADVIQPALEMLATNLEKIGATILSRGILNQNVSSASLDI